MGAVLGIFTVIIVCGAVEASPKISLLLTGLSIATMVLFRISRFIWWPGAFIILFNGFAFASGTKVEAVCFALTLIMAIYLTARSVISGQLTLRTSAIIVLAWIFIIVWFILMFVPNVPSIGDGVLGFRKSCGATFGLIIGVCWPRESEKATVVRFIWKYLIVLVVICIGVHEFDQSFEQHLYRTANIYTGLFNGKPRLQGIFAGPFHVSLASAFLIVAAIVVWFGPKNHPMDRLLAIISASVGVVGLVLAEVRTGYLALGLGFLTLLFFRQNDFSRRRAIRFATTLGFLVVLLLIIRPGIFTQIDPAAASLSGLSSNSRALGRLATWAAAGHLIAASPIIGWGTGSAGDTLSNTFIAAGSQGVTPHNVLLKYAVEGGIPGLVLVVALCITTLKTLSARTRKFSVVAFALLFLFCMFGDEIEALPVSLYVLAIIGLEVDPISMSNSQRLNRQSESTTPHSTS